MLIFTQVGEAAGASGQPGVAEPQREREGCLVVFGVLQHLLKARAGFRRPGRGLGSVFSGSGGEMAR